MTYWGLALVLLALLAGVGLRQGAIRMGVSLLGILVGMASAAGLGHSLLTGLLFSLGVKSPVVIWAAGPALVFLAISFIFKAIGLSVHRKAEYHYRYRATELKQSLWERLNRRLGLCLGLVNGLLYLLLISWAIYAFGYWTQRLAQPSGIQGDSKSMRVLNTIRRDLDQSGFTNAVLAIDHMPKWYYPLGDLLGVLYRTPQARPTLERYPGFMNLLELTEFRGIWTNKEFIDMWTGHKPIKDLLALAPVDALLNNREHLKLVGDTLIRDLDDLPVFLTSGKSPKYDHEPILGGWTLDANATLTRRVRTGALISHSDMLTLERQIPLAFHGARLIAMPDNDKVLLKDLPSWRKGPGFVRTLSGDWKKEAEGKYRVSVSDAEKKLTGTFDTGTGQIVLAGDEFDLVFVKEN